MITLNKTAVPLHKMGDTTLQYMANGYADSMTTATLQGDMNRLSDFALMLSVYIVEGRRRGIQW